VTAKSKVTLAPFCTLMLRFLLIDLIEIGFHDHSAIELHLNVGAIDRYNLLVPFTYRLEMTFFGRTRV